MNFIKSLFVIKIENTYILNLICYFSKFDISFAIKIVNVENVIWYLKFAFVIYRKRYAIYCDKNYHFFNNELKKFLRLKKINIIYNSFKTFKNTRIIEAFNKILETILRKDSFQINLKWNRRIFKLASSINSRIIEHLNILSHQSYLIKFIYLQLLFQNF